MRKSKGRQKVKMEKMTKESNLQVTFSKRRSGLFKKASELCTLCGAEVALIVFSPGEKVFSFGHPCVETIVDRFMSRSPSQSSGTLQLIEAHRNANVRELNAQLTQILGQLDTEKKRGDELTRIRKVNMAQCWWEGPVDEMNMGQLDQLRASLEELKKNVARQADRVLIHNSNPPPPVPVAPPLQFYAGSSSNPGGPSGGGFNSFEAKINAGFDGNMIAPNGFNFGYGGGRGFY